MNFGVIGTFWLTENMIKSMSQIGDAKYCAQYSRQYEKASDFAAKNGCNIKIYDNIYNMANDPDIDAIYIASPNYTHYDYAKIMLSAGKHVLCEKPICINSKQYNELCEISNNNNVVLMEAMMNVHQPQFYELKKIIENIGDPIIAKLDFCQRSSKADAAYKGIIASTFDKSCAGGVLMDLGVYVIYIAQALFGKPLKISANATFFDTGVDITDNIILSYKQFDVVITISKLTSSLIGSEILCKNGTVTIENLSRLQNIVVTTADGKQDKISFEHDFVECMMNELTDFIDFANGNRQNDYKRYQNLALDVITTMENIRAIINYDI